MLKAQSDKGSNSELLDLLNELAILCENHGYSWHADCIRETISAFGKSENDGWDHLVSIQFWGGSGSICDASFSSDEIAWHTSNDRPVSEYLLTLSPEGFSADNKRHMELLSRISKLIPADCAKQESLVRWFERAKRMGEIYNNWLTNPNAPKVAIL